MIPVFPGLWAHQPVRLALRDVLEGEGIDAVAEMGGRRPIGENVAEMAVATGAADFGANHSVGVVLYLSERLRRNGRSK